MLTDLSPAEKTILSDKLVDIGEIKRAGATFANCVSLTGATAEFHPALPTDLGPDAYEVSYDDDPSTNARVERGISECRAEVDAVVAVWVLQNQSGADEVAAAQKQFQKCAKAAGLTFDSSEDWTTTAIAAVAILSSRDSSAVPVGVDVPALRICVGDVTKATTTALPGLQDALANLNVS